jgi:acetamidase/formamidase
VLADWGPIGPGFHIYYPIRQHDAKLAAGDRGFDTGLGKIGEPASCQGKRLTDLIREVKPLGL